MLNNLDRLRADHVEILTIIAEIQHLLQPSTVRKKAEIVQELVLELTRRTLSHLLLEDKCLYQEMLISTHDETRALAQKHVVSMGSMAGHLRDYVKAWPSQEKIISLPERFCDESRYVLEALQLRINREEHVLYPKAESIS